MKGADTRNHKPARRKGRVARAPDAATNSKNTCSSAAAAHGSVPRPIASRPPYQSSKRESDACQGSRGLVLGNQPRPGRPTYTKGNRYRHGRPLDELVARPATEVDSAPISRDRFVWQHHCRINRKSKPVDPEVAKTSTFLDFSQTKGRDAR